MENEQKSLALFIIASDSPKDQHSSIKSLLELRSKYSNDLGLGGVSQYTRVLKETECFLVFRINF